MSGIVVTTHASKVGERTSTHLSPTPAAVERAIRSIAVDGGTGSMAAIDARRGRSRARFGEAFRDAVGVSPSRSRASCASTEVSASSRVAGVRGDVALDAGYDDQGHFTSEFRTHARLTPRAYVRALRFPESTSVADPADRNFQDAAVVIA